MLYNISRLDKIQGESMDPITHCLSGAILSRTGFYQRFGRLATIILITGALIPDIDHFSLRLAGPLAYLKYHRGFTHSIMGSLVIAAVMAGAAYSIKEVRSRLPHGLRGYGILFGLSLLGIYAHIFFDLITSYGTQIFFPFSTKRYSLDIVFIIDLYFTSILLIPLIIILFKKERAQIIALGSLVGIIAYLGFTYIERSSIIEKVKADNNKIGIKSTTIEAIPLPLSPFRWSVFTEDNVRYYQTNVDALNGRSTTEVFNKKVDGSDIVKMVENLDIVKTYLWFAKFPVVSVREEGSGYLVEYFDLRFNSLPPRRPFLLKLFVDRKGALNHAEMMFHTIK